MIVDGPAAGSLSMDLGDLNGNFSTASDPAWQNAWNSGFSFLNSAGTVYDYGTWNIKLQVFDARRRTGHQRPCRPRPRRHCSARYRGFL
jgi:hypothetical protein